MDAFDDHPGSMTTLEALLESMDDSNVMAVADLDATGPSGVEMWRAETPAHGASTSAGYDGETPAHIASTSAGYDGERCQGAMAGEGPLTYLDGSQLRQPSNGTRGNSMCLVPDCAYVFQPRGSGQGRYSRYNVGRADRAAVVRRLSTMFKPDLWIEQAPDVPGGHEYKQLSAKDRVIQNPMLCLHILPHALWQSRLCPYHSGLAVDESAPATNLALPIAFATAYPNATPLLISPSLATDVLPRAASLAVPMARASAFTAASSTPAAFAPVAAATATAIPSSILSASVTAIVDGGASSRGTHVGGDLRPHVSSNIVSTVHMAPALMEPPQTHEELGAAMDPSVIVKVQDLERQKKLAVEAEERHAARARAPLGLGRMSPR